MPLPFGDPLDETTVIGPLASSSQRDRVEAYLKSGMAAGARLVIGGGRPAHLTAGWYVEPTVFADVDNSMTLAQEEIFGPVLSIIPYDADDEVVAIANDSVRPLRGGVDAGRRPRLVHRPSGQDGNLQHQWLRLRHHGAVRWFQTVGTRTGVGVEGLDPYLEYKTINLPAPTQAS
jgi:aldehyde dehydrogenase (NAD+)